MKSMVTTIYISKDGAKFFDRFSCLQHERIKDSIRRENWIDRHYSDLAETLKALAINERIHFSLSNLNIGDEESDIIKNIAIYQCRETRRTTIVNLRNGRCGKAICNTHDDFDSKCGWAVAWARYHGEEIPNYI